MRLRELAASRVRFGYRRLTVILRREGWRVNPKRIYQYTEDGNQAAQEVGAKIAGRYTQGDAAQSKVEHGLHERKTP